MYRGFCATNKLGFWIWWSNLLDIYTTGYNSLQITIWHTVIFFRLNTPLELFWLPAEPSKSQSNLLYDWRFTANQIVLASGPLRPKTRDFFFQLNSCDNSPYVTSSLTWRWVCLLWICLAFSQVYIPHVYHVIEKSSFCTTHKSSVSTGFTEQIMPALACRMLLEQFSHLKERKLDHHQVKGSCTYFLCLASPCIIVYIWKVESCVQIADWCAPWKISNGEQDLVLHAL
jgi:hypothetical protein